MSLTLTQQQINLLQRLSLQAKRDKFDVYKLAFPAQRKALKTILAPSRKPKFITIKNSRRTGKTYLGCLALLAVSTTRPGTRSVFIALTRQYAKELAWDLLLELNDTYALGGIANHSELKLRFPNNSVISLHGSNHEKETRKLRGKKYALVIIDEFHIFPPYGSDLINSVLAPACAELNAPIVVLWTPPPALVGPAVETWHSPSWEKLEWDLRRNPWFKKQSGTTPAQWIKDECERRGVTIDDPIIQREAFGRLVEDPDSLAFKYSEVINNYDKLPAYTTAILGVDVGWNDADACSALVFDEAGAGDMYIAEDEVKSHQTDDDLARLLKKFVAKYDPIKIVVDTAGNRKTFETVKKILRRAGIHTAMEPRQMLPVVDQVGIVNDALRSGRLRAKATSTFAADTKRIVWKDGVVGGKLASHPHSDAIPAATNAIIAALPLLPEDRIVDERTIEEKKAELAAEAKRERMERAQRQAKKARGERSDDDCWVPADAESTDWITSEGW